MIIKFSLDSKSLKRQVPIAMYLPDDYMASRQSYPVLYMLDGQNLFYDEDASFGRSWRLITPLQQLDQPMIVVGIESSREGLDRLAEYSPCPFYDADFHQSFKADGKKTLTFLTKVLKPYVDAHFPTRKGRNWTWIGGSSCGATMALQGLMQASNVYSKAVLLSPYVTVMEGSLLAMLDETTFRLPSSVFMSWGAREGGSAHEFIRETETCTQIANILQEKGVPAWFHVRHEGEHNEAAWEQEAPLFLNFLIHQKHS